MPTASRACEEVVSATGQRVRLARPLDFLVVADHSDAMGLFPRLLAGEPEVMADPNGRRWHAMVKAGGEQGVAAALELIAAFGAGKMDPKMVPTPGSRAFRSVWDLIIRSAEEANQPGRFTAFIGYEWTSNTKGNNLHRVVIFRDGAEKASQVEPLTTEGPAGSDNPRDLWKWLQGYETKTGGQVLAIPHNGNLSNGRMFPVNDPVTGTPLDRAYAETRALWEPLAEVTQIKGDGEAHPFLSPNDEFANFERWDSGNLDLSELKTQAMLQYEYMRSALKIGLELEAKLGVNPYRVGMIGSTDSHTGLATADDDNFFGKHAGSEPSAKRWQHPFIVSADGSKRVMGWQTLASGYAGVWARENTRAAIFDAMQRKEVYGTTGPRMIVRFFGGWEFTAGGCRNAAAGGGRLPEGRADGWRPGCCAGRQVTGLPGRRVEGSAGRQSRSGADREGLAGCAGQGTGEGVRRGLGRRAQAGCRGQAAACRQYRGRGAGDLDQHDRRRRADHGLAGPGVQPGAAGLLLRPGARDPDAALDGV